MDGTVNLIHSLALKKNRGFMNLRTVGEAKDFYTQILSQARNKTSETIAILRQLILNDLFFFIHYFLGRKDLDGQWLFERCKEVQEHPNGYLDLWAREHYKSTIITHGLTIQDVLWDPEVTLGIFSFNRPTAKGFLRAIKWEMESNKALKDLFPDILWADPQKQAPKWSEDDGLVVKRRGSMKESTVEAWGLIDAMPTGRHFKIRLYDDIITERHVTSPDMIMKAVESWELSLNLGSQQICSRYGVSNIERYCGSRYHYNDPYKQIANRGSVKERKYPATDNGEMDGEPVLWPREVLAQKRRDMGPYTFGCQILLNPKAEEVQGFNHEWLQNWKGDIWDGLNVYLLCDPASEKKKVNDYTVMLVIGLGEDNNYYLIDGIRDRLNLTERTKQLFAFHKKYRPIATGYERYGKDSDIEHILYVQERENYRFQITELAGNVPKNDRIRKLVPIFEQKRFYLPERLIFRNYEGKEHDLVNEFVNDEYLAFPLSAHDDILDCMARILHEELFADFPHSRKLKVKMPSQRTFGAADWML